MIESNKPTGTHAPECQCRICRAHRDDYDTPRMGERVMPTASIIVTSVALGYALERYVTRTYH